MKQPKKLTRSLKEQLTNKGLDATEYVIIDETNDQYIVQKKDKLKTEEDIIEIDKDFY